MRTQLHSYIGNLRQLDVKTKDIPNGEKSLYNKILTSQSAIHGCQHGLLSAARIVQRDHRTRKSLT